LNTAPLGFTVGLLYVPQSPVGQAYMLKCKQYTVHMHYAFFAACSKSYINAKTNTITLTVKL